SRGRQDRQGGQDRQGLRATRKRNHHTREDKVILGFALDAEAHGSKTFCESMRPRRHGRSPVSAPSARVRKLSLEASQSATPISISKRARVENKASTHRKARPPISLSLGDLFREAVEGAHCAWRSWRPSGIRTQPGKGCDT